MKKATPPKEERSPPQGNHSANRTELLDKAPTKITRVLAYLAFSGSLNRFEAEHIGDHCLHSTISTLANNYGLAFERQLERVPNHWAQSCDVTRYSISDSERHRARDVLLLMLRKSGKALASPGQYLGNGCVIKQEA